MAIVAFFLVDGRTVQSRGFLFLFTLFLYKNKVYKNIEAENGKILRFAKNIPQAEKN